LYAALIAYASLYPFRGWHATGVSPFAFLVLPWPRWWTWFDLVTNLLGYMPLGALVFGALVRSGVRIGPSIAFACVAGAALSFSMEFLQNFLPQRVSSNVDFGVNVLGTAAGALIGLRIHLKGGVERWQIARDRWFIARSAGGLAMLLLWPIGLLFPLPVPLAQGQVLVRLQEVVAQAVEGTPIATWVEGWADADLDRSALSPGGEFALIALGLLAPCMIAFSIARPGWRRIVLAFGAAALGVLATTLSTALNFSPQHMLAWSTPQALAAVGFGVSLGCLLSALPPRAAAGVGLIVLTALVTFVAQAPSDPYFAQSLQLWEQGRFIRFHGAARWVGWLWPYAAIVYLLARLGARDEPVEVAPPKMAE
jgi:VanZ family protein